MTALVSGGFFSILLLLSDLSPPLIAPIGGFAVTRWFVFGFAIAAGGLILGVGALHGHACGVYGDTGRIGAFLAGLGFGSLLFAMLLLAHASDGFATLGTALGYLIFVLFGFFSATIGMSMLGAACWRAGVGSRLTAGLLMLAFPTFGVALTTRSLVPAPSSAFSPTVFSVTFGVAWLLVGSKLVRTAGSEQTESRGD